MKPRTTFSGSETFDTEDGSVSASQLLRVATPTEDPTIEDLSELDQKLPYVPSSNENNNISSSNNWKTSQFVGSVKYYYIQQSTAVSPTNDDLNLNISTQNWNNNLPFTIRKWMFIDGTVGSNDPNLASCSINTLTNNLTISISGNVYGAAGVGEVAGADPTNGGNALEIETFGGKNVYINLALTSKVFGGGGGGPKGGDGGNGGQGGATYLIYGMGGVSCTQIGTGNGNPGGGGAGGAGGTGRGYSNLTGSIGGSNGVDGGTGQQASVSAAAAGWGNIYSGQGGNGGKGGKGGDGGEWGQGGQLTATGGLGGGNGNNGSGGHRADVGPCAKSGCVSCNTPGTGSGSTGSAGSAASTKTTKGGKAIKTTNINSYILFGNNNDNLIGSQGT